MLKRSLGFLFSLVGILLCLGIVVTGAGSFEAMAAESDGATVVAVTNADILRGARNNVNRNLTAYNAEPDGVTVRGVFETNKPIIKAAVKKGITFADGFTVQTEIIEGDGCTMDIGILCGDVDEAWLDPWDFLGIDMSDPGSLAKFRAIGGVTVRFSMSGPSVSTVMMKGMGEAPNTAAFAVAGVTKTVPFVRERSLTFEKEGGSWKLRSGDTELTVEENATMLNPQGAQKAQSFLDATLNGFAGKEVYVFVASEGGDGASSALKIKGAGGKTFSVPFGSDDLCGDVSYEKNPERSIEFSLGENYYIGMPQYADRTFTYLSQPYQNPVYTLTDNGLYVSGRDKLYGINADVTYLTPFEKFDGFSAVLANGYMPQTTSTVNSTFSLTLNGQKFASYYAWDSVHIGITFPYADTTRGFFASVLLWGRPAGGANTLRAELPASYIPYEGGDVIVKIAKQDAHHYIYINGVRLGDGYESAIDETVQAIESGYTDSQGRHSGFYVSTLNTTAYLSDGLAVADDVLTDKPGHYLKQIGGARIVNDIPTLKSAQSLYAPEKGDVTAHSVKLSFGKETLDRTDGNFATDGYLVERYTDDAADGLFLLEGEDNTTFSDGDLKADTRYTYRVYAVQGAASASPIKLVAYKPIEVKTLKEHVVAPLAAATVGGDNRDSGMATVAVVIATVVIAALAAAVCAYMYNRNKTGKTRVYATAGKRAIAACLGMCIVFASLSGCGGKRPDGNGSDNLPSVYEEDDLLDTFAHITTPTWKSETVYNETVLMLRSGTSLPQGKLAFRPRRILSVRDYNLHTVYREGDDYVIDADGNITLPDGSDCPYLAEENLQYATRPAGVEGLYEFPASTAAKPNLMYTETPYLVQKQICVTYEYDMSDFSVDVVSVADESKLPGLRRKLADKSQIRMAVLGDSISEGANSSSFLNIPPYQATYSSLFRGFLEKKFGVDVVFENYSLGGMASAWGATRAYAVGQFMPDVVILSFGANDGGTGQDNSVTPVSVADFTRNIREAMDNIRKYNPDCEFILVSSLKPNPDSAAFGIQGDYAVAMAGIADSLSYAVAVDMYKLHDYFLTERGKNYADMSSNYINHPNDFLIRLYAMNIISALWE